MKPKIKYYLDENDKKEIKKQLIDLDMSIKQLSKNIGYHYSYLYQVLNGERYITSKLTDLLQTQGIVIEVS